jgi:hypothetical protein
MNYLKYTPYLYLILGIYLVFDSVMNWNNPSENAELTLIFAAIAIFLFGFRRHYAKRFEDLPIINRIGEIIRLHRATLRLYKNQRQFNVST